MFAFAGLFLAGLFLLRLLHCGVVLALTSIVQAIY
jgi:hypothetical protein